MADDVAELETGLEAAAGVLGALETLAAADTGLAGAAVSLPDFRPGAMVAYFARSARGADLLARRPRLSRWWQRFGTRPSVMATDPGLPVPNPPVTQA
jgi:glutathione S-transferase